MRGFDHKSLVSGLLYIVKSRIYFISNIFCLRNIRDRYLIKDMITHFTSVTATTMIDYGHG